MPSAKPVSTPLKYVVGIDIAKSYFVACLGQVDGNQQLLFGKATTFENMPSRFTSLLSWVARQQIVAVPLWFVVEATGVYYEELTYF
jgi:transposase